MTTTLKVLGQVAPAATTLTTLYTVPAATSAVCSTLIATNRATTATTIRVAVRVAGAAISDKAYIIYDLNVPGSNGHVSTIGISLATTDVVSVYSASGNVSFNLFGEEIT